jgi:hypothetical protein
LQFDDVGSTVTLNDAGFSVVRVVGSTAGGIVVAGLKASAVICSTL